MMTQLNFSSLFSKFKINENDSDYQRRKSLLDNNLSYLNNYQIILASESVMDLFEECESIASGGFGEVFKVKNRNSNETSSDCSAYAFKRIKMSKIQDENEVFLREVINCQKLSHENVVKFHDYWIEFDGLDGLWLNQFMELCKENLEDWFKRKDENPSSCYFKAMDMFLQICFGLKYIHSQKFIHRDIKPQNIMIDFQGTCKIGDFGLSTLHTTREEGIEYYYHTNNLGTPHYAAPEQLEKEKYDFKADIYSSGLLLQQFFIIFSNKEDLHRALTNLREKHINLNLFDHVFKEEGKLLMDMTETDPKTRPLMDEVIERTKMIKEKMQYLKDYNLVIANHLFGQSFEDAKGKFNLPFEENGQMIRVINVFSIKSKILNILNRVQLTAKLKHKNILELIHYELLYQSSRFFTLVLYQELNESSLEEWFLNNEKNRLTKTDNSIEKFKKTFQDIIDGLTYLHKFTFHGDINPSNIKITRDGEYKIMDNIPGLRLFHYKDEKEYFRTLDEDRKANYASPEQLGLNSNLVCDASDVFSLGCIMLEYICDFNSRGGIILAMIKIREAHQMPVELSSEIYNHSFKNIIFKMTETQPSKRLTLEEIEKELEICIEIFKKPIMEVVMMEEVHEQEQEEDGEEGEEVGEEEEKEEEKEEGEKEDEVDGIIQESSKTGTSTVNFLKFSDLFVNFKTDESNNHVKRKRKLLANELSYLNEYQVLVGRESVMDIFSELQSIGTGQTGEVFKVKDFCGNDYAFKRIKMKKKKEDDLKTLREVMFCRDLKHENVINFYEYWIEFDSIDGLWINLFMELCEESLEDWIWRENENKTFDYPKSINIFSEICNGLSYLHSEKIIHRDLNPSNILITFNGVCKIGDFGLSTLHTKKNENAQFYYHTVILKTPLYAAPEQKKNSEYGFEVDIYALGCILIQLFTIFETYDDLISTLVTIQDENKLPTSFESQFKEEGQLILDMTRLNPELRPNIGEVVPRVKTFQNKFHENEISDLSNKKFLVKSNGSTPMLRQPVKSSASSRRVLRRRKEMEEKKIDSIPEIELRPPEKPAPEQHVPTPVARKLKTPKESDGLEAIAVLAWKPKNVNNLAFDVGDIILIKRERDEWLFGEFNDKTGWFTRKNVKLVGTKSFDDYYIAANCYFGKNEGDIQFTEGQLIQVIQKDNDDEWTGIIIDENGKEKERGTFSPKFVRVPTPTELKSIMN